MTNPTWFPAAQAVLSEAERHRGCMDVSRYMRIYATALRLLREAVEREKAPEQVRMWKE